MYIYIYIYTSCLSCEESLSSCLFYCIRVRNRTDRSTCRIHIHIHICIHIQTIWKHPSPFTCLSIFFAFAYVFSPYVLLAYVPFFPYVLLVGVRACMGGSWRCIVAFAHLGNGTSCRTVAMAAPLAHCGMAKYEARLHNERIKMFFGVCVYVCVRALACTKGCMKVKVNMNACL